VATATETEAARALATNDAGPPTNADHLRYHPALDGLRGVAVLAVIAYHDNYTWAKGGFLGVDAFFVLSGFLITTLLVLEFRRGRVIHLASFWARRARRLLPALLLVLVFVSVYTRLAVVPWERTRIRGDGLASLFYVANWRFVVDGQGYFSLFSAASPLRHMWSLAIEEQYYLVWPIVVLVCLKVARGSLRVLTAVCVAGIGASVIAMRVRFVARDPSHAYYATDARAHSLLIGALLGLVLLAWRPSALATRRVGFAAALGLIAVLLAFTRVSGTDAAYYRGGSAVFALTCAAVIAGAVQRGSVSALLSASPLVWTGRISYGLYLWHWPIDVWLVPSRVSLGANALNALRLAVTFAAAIASYHLVERPIRTRSFRPRAAVFAFAPAAAAVVIVVWLSAGGATPLPGYLAGAAPSPADASAAGLPNFIWGYGDPLLCGEPRASETAEATEASARGPRLPIPPAAAARVLLVGDSTACSLWPGLRAVAQQNGIATDQGSVFGCGIASGEVTSTRNEAVTPNSSRCPQFLDYAVPRALARSNPTLVIWMSVWEKSDLVVDGRTIVAGTPEWEATIQSRMDTALARLTAGGAHVVMVTEAAPAPNPAQGTETFDRQADDAGYARLNALLRRFAARHLDTVSLVDLATRLCADGPPCPANVEGMEARPDGRHFTPTAAVWAARVILSDTFSTR
jgi:peptidoglycan/LPS O-acetylase OafA/YrhL